MHISTFLISVVVLLLPAAFFFLYLAWWESGWRHSEDSALFDLRRRFGLHSGRNLRS